MARLWRAFHPEPLEPETEVELSRDEAHHVRRVLRLRVGDELALFDGRGREWSAGILSIASDVIVVRVGDEIDRVVESPLEIEIHQGLGRSEHMEWAIQKATELGVVAIRLWASERSERRKPAASRLRRWERIAVEACKQCGRRRVPVIGWEESLPPNDDPGSLALVLDPSERGLPLGRRLDGPAPRRIHLAAGPESGLTPAEIDAAAAVGWLPTALGPRVLRTETAAVIAAALCQYRWGDLGGSGGPVDSREPGS